MRFTTAARHPTCSLSAYFPARNLMPSRTRGPIPQLEAKAYAEKVLLRAMRSSAEMQCRGIGGTLVSFRGWASFIRMPHAQRTTP
jgi:hypothetical protein